MPLEWGLHKLLVNTEAASMKNKIFGEKKQFGMNKILAALPSSSREWTKTLEPVSLSTGSVLFEPDEAIEHVYFLTNAGIHSFHEFGRFHCRDRFGGF